MAVKKQVNQSYYIDGLLNNNSKILREIYTEYSDAILKYILQHNGTPEDARDIFQEALIVIYKKAKTDNFKLTSSFFTFFYAVCRNLWFKKLKKKKHETVTIDKELVLIDDTNIEEAILVKDRHELYLKKLKELSASCQQILQLHIEGKGIKEIVKFMGLSSEGYARKRKHKCKQQLFNRIKQDKSYSELI